MAGKAQYFIQGIGMISPQKTFDNQMFLEEITTYDQNVLTAVVPDFKAYINPIQLRRLSRMLRVGLASATICLRDAGIEHPDGIITATGYGFLDETEKFLREMLEMKEKQLTPTHFMQGTYNALAGLEAVMIKCMGYNNTYVSKGFAFENALQDAMMRLDEDQAAHYLVGSYDEAAAVQFIASIRENHFKTEPIVNLNVFDTTTKGTIQGEGAAFFDLTGTPSENTWCELVDVAMVYRPETKDDLAASLFNFLKTNHTSLEEVDVWLNGITGDVVRDVLLKALEQSDLKAVPQARYKHLCGDYCTVTSFALWLGASMLKKQSIPEVVKASAFETPKEIKTVLSVSHYMNRNYAFMLMQRA